MTKKKLAEMVVNTLSPLILEPTMIGSRYECSHCGISGLRKDHLWHSKQCLYSSFIIFKAELDKEYAKTYKRTMIKPEPKKETTEWNTSDANSIYLYPSFTITN